MTKPTKCSVRPAKAQISLGIRLVWSESLLFAWRKLGSLATYWAHCEDWADAQADLSLRSALRSFCWFCHKTAYIYDTIMILSFWTDRSGQTVWLRSDCSSGSTLFAHFICNFLMHCSMIKQPLQILAIFRLPEVLGFLVSTYPANKIQ